MRRFSGSRIQYSRMPTRRYSSRLSMKSRSSPSGLTTSTTMCGIHFVQTLGARGFGIEVDRLFRMAVGDHARQPHPTFAAASGVLNETGVSIFVIIEHASNPANDTPMPWAWNFGHFNDSSRQFVEPTFLEVGFDELVQRHASTVIVWADADRGSRRRRCGHRFALGRYEKSFLPV